MNMTLDIKLMAGSVATLAVITLSASTIMPASAHELRAERRASAHLANSHASGLNSARASLPPAGVVDDYAHHPYHCGIGLYGTPLPCEYDN